MKYFVLRGASKRTKTITSFALALLMVFQTIGPGVFALKTANATVVEKINICHKNGESDGWNALRVNLSGWGGHSGHSSDYIYAGPTEHGEPDGDDHKDDNWCSSHVPPKLTVTKTVVNAGGGTKIPNDFNLKVDNTAVLSGVALVTTTGSHTVSETNLDHYTAGAWGGDCNANGQVTLAYGNNKTCTITNTYVPPVEDVCPNIEGVQETIPQGLIKNNDGQCVESRPLPDLENTCALPTTLEGSKITTFGVSPEKTLQMVLDEAGYSINTLTQETGYQAWNIPVGTESVTIDAKFIKAIAGNGQEVGYYFDGNLSSYVPLVKTAGHSGVAPVLAEGASIPSQIINTVGHTSIGFALDTEGVSPAKYATQVSLNTLSEDHAVVYNSSSNKYILGFEDLPFAAPSDKDYQDMIIEVNIKSCVKTRTQCEPGVELIKNGSFEAPIVAGSWNAFPQGTANLDWTVEWMPNVLALTPPMPALLELQRTVYSPTADGLQYAELDSDWLSQGGKPSSVNISQAIPTVPGKTYEVKFAFSPRPGTSEANNQLAAYWNGNQLGSTISANGIINLGNVWTNHVLSFVATSSMTQVSFADLGTSDSLGTFIDNVSVKCLADCIPSDGTVVSDTSVTDTTDAHPAVALTFVHPAWTANIPGATWIWATNPVESPTNDADLTKVFTKTFTITGNPTGGTLDIAADNNYSVKVNGNVVPVVFDQNNFQLETQDSYNVGAFLVSGSNTIEVTVTNKEINESGDPAANPAGVLFKLSWRSDCGGGDGGPNDLPTSTVTLHKYVDGVAATTGSFSVNTQATWNDGTAHEFMETMVLNSPTYLDTSVGLTNEQNSFAASEVTGGESNVLPIDSVCQPGKYQLVGYSYGNTLEAALSATKSTGLNLQNINSNQQVIVWNKTCPTSANIVVTKIVCSNEADLPNRGDGVGMPNPPIDATTAANWIGEAHPSCHLESGWNFQWAPEGTTNPGDNNMSAGSPWTISGATAIDGTISINVPVAVNGHYVWVREVPKNGYIPFSGDTSSEDEWNDVSAEIYCNVDVLNYDNYDRVDNMVAGQTYHCVAWNVPTQVVDQCDDDECTNDDPTPEVPPSITTTDSNEGDGGGGSRSSHRNSSVAGASTSSNNPTVLGATIDVPELPDTGNGAQSQGLMISFALFCAFIAVNTVAVRRMRGN